MSDYDVPRPMADFFAKLEDLDAYTHQVTQQWPRGERFALTARVREQMTQIQRLSVIAWKRKSKAGVLFDIDVEVAVLRVLVRKAYRLRSGRRLLRVPHLGDPRPPAQTQPEALEEAVCWLRRGRVRGGKVRQGA